MDFGLIINKKISTQQIDIKDNVFFKSSIILISSEGQFNSKYQWLTKDMSNRYNNNLELMKELNNLYVFSLDQQ
jgi:hypothetical protein